MLVNAVKEEKMDIRKCRSQENVIRAANIKSILTRIILDEERHILKKLKSKNFKKDCTYANQCAIIPF